MLFQPLLFLGKMRVKACLLRNRVYMKDFPTSMDFSSADWFCNRLVEFTHVENERPFWQATKVVGNCLETLLGSQHFHASPLTHVIDLSSFCVRMPLIANRLSYGPPDQYHRIQRET